MTEASATARSSRPVRRWSGARPWVLASVLGLMSPATHAAPEEIQVYMDDMTKPGNFGTDIHNNFVVSGSSTPDSPGAEPPEHVYRLTPEFYYGASDSVELGLYLLTTTPAGHAAQYDGAKLRIKYIATHDDTQGSFWGANLEIGRTSLRVSQAPWNAELKGIYGFRTGRWTFAGNANLDWSLTGPGGTPVTLDVDTKLAYALDAGYQLGFESYNELGPLHHLGGLNGRSEMLYAVVDTAAGKFDLNAGIGRGLTPASDHWVIKFIIGIHY